MSTSSTNYVKAYYHLAKPGIVYGNLLAVMAGFCLASADVGFSVPKFIGVVVAIALIIGGSCVCNNITDKAIDAKMERTKKRALVRGTISPVSAAVYAFILLLVGFILLWIFSNPITVVIGIIGVLDYVILYAFAKRHTHFGTAVGTVSGAAPLMAGYTAASATVDSAAIILFIVMFFWQMTHFYAIAVMRQQDYANAHIPVHPILHGPRSTKNWILLYAIGFVATAPLLTIFGYTGVLYSLVVLGVGWYWLYGAMATFKLRDTTLWARQVFKRSLIVLLIFCVAVAVGGYLP